MTTGRQAGEPRATPGGGKGEGAPRGAPETRPGGEPVGEPVTVAPTALALRTDEQLMAGCREASDEQARACVGELARRYLVRVSGFVASITGDATGAQDLAQEAFVRVFRRRADYRDVGRFSTWLYTIARNLALNEVRDRKHRPGLSLDRGAGGPGAGSDEGPALGAAVAGRGGSPADAAAQGDVRALVHRAIAQLEPHHREVVVLCELEERSYAEAAEVLGVPVGTVRSRLFRAREQLARRLEGVLS